MQPLKSSNWSKKDLEGVKRRVYVKSPKPRGGVTVKHRIKGVVEQTWLKVSQNPLRGCKDPGYLLLHEASVGLQLQHYLQVAQTTFWSHTPFHNLLLSYTFSRSEIYCCSFKVRSCKQLLSTQEWQLIWCFQLSHPVLLRSRKHYLYLQILLYVYIWHPCTLHMHKAYV